MAQPDRTAKAARAEREGIIFEPYWTASANFRDLPPEDSLRSLVDLSQESVGTGDVIRGFRERARCTERELERRIGRAPGSGFVNKIEMGSRAVSSATISQMAKACDVQPFAIWIELIKLHFPKGFSAPAIPETIARIIDGLNRYDHSTSESEAVSEE